MNDGSTLPESLPAERSRFSNIPVDLAGVRFQNYGDMRALAVDMASAGAAIPPIFRDSPGACLGVIIDAVRFGMNPYALAREAYIVNANKESASLAYMAKAIHAIVLSRVPLAKRPQFTFSGEKDDLVCKVTFTLTDGDVIEHESPRIGDITIKNSPLWKSDRKLQLSYYTVRAAGRLHFPDVLMGLYTPEEREALTVDVTPRTSGVSKRLAAPDAAVPTHAETVKREMAPKTAPEVSTMDAAIAATRKAGMVDLAGALEDFANDPTPMQSPVEKSRAQWWQENEVKAAKKIMAEAGGSGAAQDASEGAGGSQVAVDDVNASTPTLRPTATSSGGEEESSTGATQEPSQPEAGEEGEAFTLTQDERDRLYQLTEDLAGVTTMNELNVVVAEYADLEERFSKGAQEIAGQRIAKKLDALAAKAKKRGK